MTNSNKAETTVVVVFTLILIVIIGVIMFTAYTSTNNLQSNNIDEENIVQNSTPKNNLPDTNITVPNNSIEPYTPEPVETEIAYFSTNIYDHDENRSYNIEHAIGKINGVIVKKDETFSFNSVVGPMGESQGFKEAIGFDTNGKKIKMFGGGMCQISSTIYNAALVSNLEIVERHPHSRRVYYVPKDKDATIYYDSLDLKFKNTTNDDIKIIATSTESNVTITLNKITYGI